MRTALVPLFLGLWGFGAWWYQPAPRPALVDSTFESSRLGAVPIESPGPFTQGDFLRLILRRSGPFHLDVTREYRFRRLADPVDLWQTAIPGVLKIDVAGERIQVADAPQRLRMGVGTFHN